MATIEESIDVNVPVQVAYNQWTQFEEFPTFMDGVESVREVDATHLHWTAEIGGRRHEWGRRDHQAGTGPAGRLDEHEREPAGPPQRR